MNLTIGKNIKKLRLDRKITQEELAKQMKVSCAAVSKWERNDCFPDITLLVPLACYFGVTIDELMGYNQSFFEGEISEKMMNIQELMERNHLDDARKLMIELKNKYPYDLKVFNFYINNTIEYFNKLDIKIPKICQDFLYEIADKIENEMQLLFARHS